MPQPRLISWFWLCLWWGQPETNLMVIGDVLKPHALVLDLSVLKGHGLRLAAPAFAAGALCGRGGGAVGRLPE